MPVAKSNIMISGHSVVWNITQVEWKINTFPMPTNNSGVATFSVNKLKNMKNAVEITRTNLVGHHWTGCIAIRWK